MGLQDIEKRNRSGSLPSVKVLADVCLALVLGLVSLAVFSPKMASKLDVPFKIFIPVSAILLLVRAVVVSKEQP
jgi:hypothetical protein